jgi:hypothetical protein
MIIKQWRHFSGQGSESCHNVLGCRTNIVEYEKDVVALF